MKSYFIAPLLLQKFIWIPTRFILTLFGHIKIRGLHNLKGVKGTVIFACNHASEIDPFIVPASLPFWSRFSPLFYATRERSFYSTNGWRKYLFGGMFINAWGGYTAITGLHNYDISLADHIAIAKDGGSFCVYPEGGITRTGALQPAKGGMAYLAEKGGCTVIPVGVSGTYRTPLADFFLGKRHITVNFGLPITAEELSRRFVSTTELGPRVYKLRSGYVMEKVGELMKESTATHKQQQDKKSGVTELEEQRVVV